jgi:metal-dependent amidase/aminoacylase/carboxypeptidase family protein
MVDVKEMVKEQKDLIINTRRDLHRIPETAFTEKKTADYVADYLNREGFEVQTGIAKFGVVGLLNTGIPGPTLLIRADMDALPLSEKTGLAFSSTHEGVMHACGHDAHMAVALGADFELKFERGYPPTINDESMLEVVRRCAEQVVGKDRVVEPDPTMGGEDMAYYLQKSKGFFFALGVGREDGAPIHNPEFDFNEEVLLLGVETHCRIGLDLLS